jgi:sulfonate transport system substrate-binding protein
MITRRHTLAGLASTPLLHHAAVADSVTLRAGDQKGGTQSLMKAAGVLDDVPYQITWNQFAAAAPLLEALNAGAVDLAFAGDAPATFALAAGLQARIVAPIRTTGAGTAILVPNTSPIRTVADLRGRSVATNRGSIGHALVLAIIQAQGWAPGDIKLVNLMPSEAKSALSVGAVDAWCSWGVYVAQARLVDGARVVVDGGHGLMTGLSYLLATDTAIAHSPIFAAGSRWRGAGHSPIRAPTPVCWPPRSASARPWRVPCSTPNNPSRFRSTPWSSPTNSAPPICISPPA